MSDKPNKEMAERLKRAREAAGFKTATDAADALGVKRQTYFAHENGTRSIGLESLTMYSRRFKAGFLWLARAEGEPPVASAAPLPPTDQGPVVNAPPQVLGLISLPRDVPVLGVTVGGNDSDFQMNFGEPADYTARPPTLQRAGKVFALYVQGTSMSRWREPGQLVYLDPVRPARPGDKVVVECLPERQGDGHPAYLKELVGKTATKLKLKQYNPETVIEIPLSRVKHIHRVMEWEELLGV